jgi:hypothetical protein
MIDAYATHGGIEYPICPGHVCEVGRGWAYSADVEKGLRLS